MRLAWRNLLNSRIRLAVTVVGVAFAVYLMVFQGSLLAGFVTEGTLGRAFEASHRGKILESCSYGPEGLEGLRKIPEAKLRFEVDVELSDTVIENVKGRCEALRKPHDETSTDEKPSKNNKWIHERRLKYVLPTSWFST